LNDRVVISHAINTLCLQELNQLASQHDCIHVVKLGKLSRFCHLYMYVIFGHYDIRVLVTVANSVCISGYP